MKTKEFKNIRLTEYELKAIKETAKEVFGNKAKVWLFGSRVNPNAKGGDIDIYIEIPNYEETDVFSKKVKFLVQLEDKIGEQKIDVITAPYNCEKFYCIEAKKTGVRIL
ncbi:nucleotidyltransferase domain-containing protein [Persephonella sp. KM09-Lau-8]|uniref:nucleotidyltransferase domain-containing protein n=1 Tax=Persephonella sp. KM09-Lau-8 TaxID=1158345 RepID=UPI000496376F|nr:nucleotidyltransferase domain-containing protein [Persephonella sp. KM09-Lau-8]